MKLEVKKVRRCYDSEPYKLYVNEELVFETGYIDKLSKRASEFIKLGFSE